MGLWWEGLVPFCCCLWVLLSVLIEGLLNAKMKDTLLLGKFFSLGNSFPLARLKATLKTPWPSIRGKSQNNEIC